MQYAFGVYTLDTQCYELRCGGTVVPCSRQVFQCLAYLLAHRQRVVPRQELFQHLWQECFVSDAALERCITKARQAVGDNGIVQRCIQTVHGIGYRFVDTVYEQNAGVAPSAAVSSRALLPLLPASELREAAPTAHNEAVLPVLLQCLERALQGQRQMVFLTGHNRGDMTALIERLVDRLPSRADGWLGYGQCSRPYGCREAYLPVLIALGHICRDPHAPALLPLLVRHAPSWALQMPTLLSDATYRFCTSIIIVRHTNVCCANL